MDLFYRDHLSAPGQPLLLGAPLPWDYGEVFTPGTSMAAAPLAVEEASQGSSGASLGADVDLGQVRGAVGRCIELQALPLDCKHAPPGAP